MKKGQQDPGLVTVTQSGQTLDKITGAVGVVNIMGHIQGDLQVINLSEYALSEVKMGVLQRGLTFSPMQVCSHQGYLPLF